jgi:hypothetical protein
MLWHAFLLLGLRPVEAFPPFSLFCSVVSTPLRCKKLLTDSITESMFGLFATSFMPCAALFGQDLICALILLLLSKVSNSRYSEMHISGAYSEGGLPQQYGTG